MYNVNPSHVKKLTPPPPSRCTYWHGFAKFSPVAPVATTDGGVGGGGGWGGYFLHCRPPTLNPADQLTILPAVAKGDGGRREEGNSEPIRTVLEFLNNLWGLGTE